MVKRLALFIILAGLAFVAWENRQILSGLAGLESNQLRIEGDWQQVHSNIRDADIYTFYDKLIDRNGDSYGTYLFESNDELHVTLGGSTETYWVEFPQTDVMIWLKEIKGERTPVLRWQR